MRINISPKGLGRLAGQIKRPDLSPEVLTATFERISEPDRRRALAAVLNAGNNQNGAIEREWQALGGNIMSKPTIVAMAKRGYADLEKALPTPEEKAEPKLPPVATETEVKAATTGAEPEVEETPVETPATPEPAPAVEPTLEASVLWSVMAPSTKITPGTATYLLQRGPFLFRELPVMQRLVLMARARLNWSSDPMNVMIELTNLIGSLTMPEVTALETLINFSEANLRELRRQLQEVVQLVEAKDQATRRQGDRIRVLAERAGVPLEDIVSKLGLDGNAEKLIRSLLSGGLTSYGDVARENGWNQANLDYVESSIEARLAAAVAGTYPR